MKRTYFKKTKKLFTGPNEEKASGLSFSVAIVAQYVFTLLFLIAARLCGGLKEGYESKDWFLYFSYFIPQTAFAVTAFTYFSRTETSVKAVAKKPRAIYFCIAITLQLGLLSLSSVNGLFLKWLERFGYTPASPAVPSMSGAKIIPALLFIAVLPACLEELFFRGIVFHGMKKFGNVAAVLASAGLFALYHQSPAQTIYLRGVFRADRAAFRQYSAHRGIAFREQRADFNFRGVRRFRFFNRNDDYFRRFIFDMGNIFDFLR